MLRIDLYTDIICPWCFVGQHRLDKVLQERFPGLAADIIHHPVLLLPDAPAAGRYISDMLRERYGVTDPASAFAGPEAAARASGVDLDLGRQRYAYPTQAAHALILAAGARGTQHQLAVAITDAYFLAARNIADADVLADIAAAHGFGREEARAIALDASQHRLIEQAAASAGAAGVRSVPHFVFENRFAINGVRSEDEMAGSIQAAMQVVSGSR